ncbi:MAG: molybdopterin-dependent oxidoreductase [Chloroflexi bacterium]|nr:molybdopterin-dependent oxidoreductase [Chloroflexota bacterium]
MDAIVSGCPYDCGGSCPLTVYVEEGVIRRVGPYEEPDSPEKPQLRPCARGLAQAQYTHHPDRLRYPLKRVGERGEGLFERISWEEALDTVAREIERIKQEYGPQAILQLRGAGNTDGLLHGTRAIPNRFFNALGEHTAPRGVISYEGAAFAMLHSFGFNLAPPGPESLLRSKLVIMWGLNPSETIFGTNTNYYLALDKERGTRFVFVDPRYTDSAAALADQWIPILPGTDTAMLVAMAYVIIQERLYDEAFLKRYTVGFEAFRDHCLGVEDGIPKTPAWAEGICGVRAEVIAALAREYATTKPADLRAGWAPGRTAYGEQFHRASIALAAMTGNTGVPGGGAGCFLSQTFRELVDVATPPLMGGATALTVSCWRWAEAVIEGTAGGYPSDIKMIYSVGGNRLNQCGDANKSAAALRKVEFVVAQDQFLTPTARFADIVLAASTHLEREDVQTPHCSGCYLIYNNRAVAPLDESMADLDIFTALARRLGIEGFNDKTEREWLEAALAKAPVGVESLRRQGVWRPASEPDPVPLSKFVADPAAHPLPTRSGKIELYSQALAERKRADLPAVPAYVADWEGPQHPLARQYPLLLVTDHSRKRVNSTLETVPWLRELAPHTVAMSAADARARGIRSGERVKVYNDVGTVEITAQVTERIMPGVISVAQGTWYAPDERGVDVGGCVNTLCKDTISPGEAAACNAVLVQVSRVEG